MSDEADSTTVDNAGVMAALSGGYDAPTDAGDGGDPGTPNPQEQTTEVAPDPAAALGQVPDLSDLDPAARAYAEKRIADYQRGFTAKTTELADANRLLEQAGGNFESVQEAYEFAQLLQSNTPDGEQARASLYQALNEQYGNQGTPEPTAPTAPEGSDLSEFDLPPEIMSRLSKTDQLEARLNAMEAASAQRAEQEERAAYMQQVQGNLDRQWDAVTTEYPDLAEAEDYVFALGASTGGDLSAAADLYREIVNNAQAALYKNAASVPGGLQPSPAGAGHSSEPVQIESIKDAGKAALEFLMQHQEQ
jgi:soluble cytochrome b562